MKGRILACASLASLLAAGGVFAQGEALPETTRYKSANNDFSFAHPLSYERAKAVEEGREMITLTREGELALVVLYLAATGSGTPIPFAGIVEERGMPDCPAECTVLQRMEFWLAPGIEGIRYFTRIAFPPREEGGEVTFDTRGPFYGVNIHPAKGDLLIFAPQDAAAESLLFSLLPAVQPALSPRTAVPPPGAPPPPDAPPPAGPSTGALATEPVPELTFKGLPPPPVPPEEEKLFLGIFRPTLSMPQVIALSLSVIFIVLFVVLRLRRRRKETVVRPPDVV